MAILMDEFGICDHGSPEESEVKMAKVKDVIVEYHEKVNLPWTARKIAKAGLEPAQFYLDFGLAIGICEDIDTEEGRGLIALLRELGMFP